MSVHVYLCDKAVGGYQGSAIKKMAAVPRVGDLVESWCWKKKDDPIRYRVAEVLWVFDSNVDAELYLEATDDVA